MENPDYNDVFINFVVIKQNSSWLKSYLIKIKHFSQTKIDLENAIRGHSNNTWHFSVLFRPSPPPPHSFVWHDKGFYWPLLVKLQTKKCHVTFLPRPLLPHVIFVDSLANPPLPPWSVTYYLNGPYMCVGNRSDWGGVLTTKILTSTAAND